MNSKILTPKNPKLMKNILLLAFLFVSFLSFGQTDLIVNGNFHSTSAGWGTSGDFNFNTTYTQYNSSIGYAYNSNINHSLGSLMQVLTIPANATSGTFSFWHKISTDEIDNNTPYDILEVKLHNVSSGVTHTLDVLSNEDYSSGYVFKSYSIPSSLIGQQIIVEFENDNDGLKPTTFRIDDVKLLVNSTSPGGIDLTVLNATVVANSGYPGDNITATCDVTILSGSCGSTELEYYWSTDPYLSSNDLYIDDDGVSSLNANGSNDDNEYDSFNIPNVNPGVYYVLFVADAANVVAESNENNNVVYVMVTVLGAVTPDLVVINPYISLSSVYPNDGVTVSCDVSLTSGSCSPSTLKYYVSTDPYFSSNDSYIGSSSVGGLNAGSNSSYYVSKYFQIPNLSSGAYYVLFVADATNIVSEGNESNNVGYVSFNILGNSSPAISMTSSIDFGTIVYGSGGVTRPLTISNTGNALLQVYSINFPSMDFGPTWSGSIAPQSSTTISLAFNPLNPGVKSGTMTVVSNAVSGNGNVSLTANSTSSNYVFYGNLDFGQVATGFFSTKTITMENTGTDYLQVYNIITPFGFTGNWSGTLAPGQTQDIDISFEPAAQTYYGGYLSANTNATGFIDEIYCSGDGIDAIPFDLNNSGTSHLYWPFPNNSSWSNRNAWIGDYETSTSGGFGNLAHVKGDYYAQDWNRLHLAGDCNEDFNSPVKGWVIYTNSSCGTSCGNNLGNPCNGGYGNQVIIELDDAYADNYAFRVTHLNQIDVAVGDYISMGEKIGEIGSNGNSENPHAHCVLYKNINHYKSSWGLTGKQRLLAGLSLSYTGTSDNANEFSANFRFDAVIPGTGGSGIGTGLKDELINSISLFPNPTTGIVYLKGIESLQFKSIEIFNSLGSSIYYSENQARSVDLSLQAPGVYFVTINTVEGKLTKRLILSD